MHVWENMFPVLNSTTNQGAFLICEFSVLSTSSTLKWNLASLWIIYITVYVLKWNRPCILSSNSEQCPKQSDPLELEEPLPSLWEWPLSCCVTTCSHNYRIRSPWKLAAMYSKRNPSAGSPGAEFCLFHAACRCIQTRAKTVRQTIWNLSVQVWKSMYYFKKILFRH